MKPFIHYRTGCGTLITSTANPSYQTRKRAAKKAKELGYSTLFEENSVAGFQRHNLSHYIK